ncbi:MAG: hypothetical protein ACYDAQ_15725, partial [Mycobacteriales bacterium]
MRLTLAGSAGPGGWPDPWCGCATCLAADPPSTATAAILDRPADAVLLDAPATALGPGALRRAGLLLLTGAGPTGLAAALLANRGAEPRPTLDVVAPDRIEGSGIRWHPAAPGAQPAPGVRVLPTPSPPKVAYLLADALLYAPAGVDATAVPANPLRLVLLACPEPDQFARTIAALRAGGAADAATRFVAVGLTHANPPLPELRHRLGLAGADLLPDGSRLELAGRTEEVALPRRVLITGGTRS